MYTIVKLKLFMVDTIKSHKVNGIEPLLLPIIKYGTTKSHKINGIELLLLPIIIRCCKL